MWLFYSLLAAGIWGIGVMLAKKGLRDISPLFNNILSAFVVMLLMIPFALINGVNFNLALSTYLFVLIVAAIYLCYYYILELGQVSLTGTILSTYPLITVILSVVLLHESPSVYQKLAIILVLAGAVFIALPEKLNSLKKTKIGNWFWWAVFGSVTTGIADYLSKIIIIKSDLNTYIFSYALAWITVVIISIFFDKKGRKIPKFNLKGYLPTIVGVTMNEVGVLVFFIAISYGLASLVTPISSVYIAITVVLAWIVLKEKITKKQILGIILSITGVILAGIS